MGNTNSINAITTIKKFNFEDMQIARMNKNSIIINTLPDDNQSCIIPGTININDEVTILNNYLNSNKAILIIIYGKNNNDDKIFLKYKQLTDLGFTNVVIYAGGMFEWLLLQEIYSDDNFPTTEKEIDILKFK